MRRWLLGMLLLIIGPQLWAALAVELDTKKVTLGETVRLTLTYDASKVQGIPDLSALQKDFVILATERSMSYTVVNGQATSVGQWGIVLEPKHVGTLTIPALSLGGQSSAPLQVLVTTSSQAAAASADPVTDQQVRGDGSQLIATVAESSPYLHQEVLYTVRFLNRERLMDLRYQPPQVDDAILFPLGQGQQSQTSIAGVLYHVDEQRYAIFPQKSGPLTIQPPAIKAVVYDLSTKPLSIKAKPLTLKVQPLPAHQSMHHWLPSKLVRLRDKVDQSLTTLDQGATLVRTITLQAQGLVAQLLPELPLTHGPGLSVYPGQVEKNNELKQEELWGSLTIPVTYVFTQPGIVTIPALHLPWFNVKTRTMETAVLPARVYHILAKTPVTPPKLPPKVKKIVPQSSPMPIRVHWDWVIGGFIVVMVILGAVESYRWWRRRSRLRRDLREACVANDPQRTAAALILWARQRWPDKHLLHLADILGCMRDQVMQDQVNKLIAALYQPQLVTPWQGKDLWQAVSHLSKTRSHQLKPTSSLPPMNPTRKF